jgi:hypothetical protein
MERYCSKNYPPQIEIHDSIVYKTKVVTLYDTVYIKADTIKRIDTVYYDDKTGLVTSRKVYAETEYANSWAQVINSKLYLELVQNDTAIANMLEANIRYKEVFKTKTVKIKVWEVHWYDKVARFIASLFILALLVLIVIKVIKMYIKI